MKRKKLIASTILAFIFATLPTFADTLEYFTPGQVNYEIDSLKDFQKTYREILTNYVSYSRVTLRNNEVVDEGSVISIIRDKDSWVSGVDYVSRYITTYENQNYFDLRISYVVGAEQRKEVDKFVETWVADNIRPGMSDYQKAKAIFKKVTTYQYYKDDDTDTSLAYHQRHSTYGLIKNGKGVCHAAAGLYRLLAEKAGLGTKDVVGYTWNEGLHIWNLVQIDDNWYHLDTTTSMGRNEIPTDGFLEGDNYRSLFMSYSDEIKDLAADGSYLY